MSDEECSAFTLGQMANMDSIRALGNLAGRGLVSLAFRSWFGRMWDWAGICARGWWRLVLRRKARHLGERPQLASRSAPLACPADAFRTWRVASGRTCLSASERRGLSAAGIHEVCKAEGTDCRIGVNGKHRGVLGEGMFLSCGRECAPTPFLCHAMKEKK